jgi:hypothetical protein
MKADQVVCDTNVLISEAIMPTGKARQAIDHVIDRGRRDIESSRIFDIGWHFVAGSSYRATVTGPTASWVSGRT